MVERLVKEGEYANDVIHSLRQAYERDKNKPGTKIGKITISDMRRRLQLCLNPKFLAGLYYLNEMNLHRVLDARVNALGIMTIMYQYIMDHHELGQAPEPIQEHAEEVNTRLKQQLLAFQGERTTGIYTTIMAPTEIQFTLRQLMTVETNISNYVTKQDRLDIKLIKIAFTILFITPLTPK